MDRWVDHDMFMCYGMDLDSEVDKDMPHEHSNRAHFVSQPHTLAPVVIDGDQDDVMPGVDNNGNVSDVSDDLDESGASDSDDSDTDQDSEMGASDSKDGEDNGDDDGYASL